MRTTTSNFARSTRFAFGLAAALLCLPPAPAAAQVRDVEPYHVIVTGERVNLRCGDGGVWYAIGQISQGQLLRVDGEGYSWLRVNYPDGTPALAPIDEADLLRERGVVVITKPSRLKAYNHRSQRVADSWKNLLANPLPPGTELRFIESVLGPNGVVEAYLVEPPGAARAFISEQFTRKATPTEIRALQAAQRRAQRQADAPEPEEQLTMGEPRPRDSATNDQAPVPDDTVADARDGDARDTIEADGDRVEEAAPDERIARRPIPEAEQRSRRSAEPPAERQAEATERRPERDVARDETTATEPTSAPASRASEDARPDAPSETPARGATPEPTSPPRDRAPDAGPQEGEASPQPADDQPTAPTFQDLDAAFLSLLKEPIEDAEIQPLIGEFRRLASTLDRDGSSRSLAARIQNRIELLEVRLDLQESMRKLASASERASRDAEAMRARLSELDRQRPYMLVGRITASSIYDGRRLPLMYRLQSVEGQGGRTLAYIVPNPELGIEGAIGSIVGIEGQTRIDEALRLRIVRPERIDRLTATLTRVDEPETP